MFIKLEKKIVFNVGCCFVKFMGWFMFKKDDVVFIGLFLYVIGIV